MSSVDSESVERAKRREGLARELIAQYIRQLRNLVSHMVNQRILAKEGVSDIVQNALASFMRANPDLDQVDDTWALLASITRHKALKVVSRYGRSKRSAKAERSLDAGVGELSFLELWEAEGRLLRPNHTDSLCLQETIASLEPKEQAFLSWLLAGKTVKQIAEEQGVNVREVQRFKKALREKLQEMLL